MSNKIDISQWTIKGKYAKKFIKLSNNQWLKIVFKRFSDKDNKMHHAWSIIIAVADTKRQCNDIMTKTRKSPKYCFGKSTGKQSGVEAFMITLQCLIAFEKFIHNNQMIVAPANKKLEKIYSKLLQYGYQKKFYICTKDTVKYVYIKHINN